MPSLKKHAKKVITKETDYMALKVIILKKPHNAKK